MSYVGALIGMAFGVFLIVKREDVGNAFGDPDWAAKVGGVYNVVILVGAFIFFWSLASLTGTTDILFAPLFMFFPHKVSPDML